MTTEGAPVYDPNIVVVPIKSGYALFKSFKVGANFLQTGGNYQRLWYILEDPYTSTGNLFIWKNKKDMDTNPKKPFITVSKEQLKKFKMATPVWKNIKTKKYNKKKNVNAEKIKVVGTGKDGKTKVEVRIFEPMETGDPLDWKMVLKNAYSKDVLPMAKLEQAHAKKNREFRMEVEKVKKVSGKNLPAMITACVNNNKVDSIAAVGTRKKGEEIQWYLGTLHRDSKDLVLEREKDGKKIMNLQGYEPVEIESVEEKGQHYQVITLQKDPNVIKELFFMTSSSAEIFVFTLNDKEVETMTSSGNNNNNNNNNNIEEEEKGNTNNAETEYDNMMVYNDVLYDNRMDYNDVLYDNNKKIDSSYSGYNVGYNVGYNNGYNGNDWMLMGINLICLVLIICLLCGIFAIICGVIGYITGKMTKIKSKTKDFVAINQYDNEV